MPLCAAVAGACPASPVQFRPAAVAVPVAPPPPAPPRARGAGAGGGGGGGAPRGGGCWRVVGGGGSGGGGGPVADTPDVLDPAPVAARRQLAPQPAGVAVERARLPVGAKAPHVAQQLLLAEHA